MQEAVDYLFRHDPGLGRIDCCSRWLPRVAAHNEGRTPVLDVLALNRDAIRLFLDNGFSIIDHTDHRGAPLVVMALPFQ